MIKLYFGKQFYNEKYIPSDEDSILEVVLIVSPKRQYLGIFDPTTPATIFPTICIYIYIYLCIYKYIYIYYKNKTMNVQDICFTCVYTSSDCNGPRCNIRPHDASTSSLQVQSHVANSFSMPKIR